MVIFLAGAHGVGKTFLGRLATKTLQFRFAVASSLIRDEMDSKQSWGKTKRTRNIDSNQEALISAVTKIQKDGDTTRSEEHTSELQSRGQIVCRRLLETKKTKNEKTP